PMNAILGMAAIAEQYAGDPEKVINCMKKISYSSKHLLALIDEILDMSRIESGKMLLENKIFSLSGMLEGIVSMFQEQFKGKKLSFNMEKRSIKHDSLIGDEFRLSRILVNILSNAIKYTPEQGQIVFSVTELQAGKEGYVRYQ
ncbi:HAMP domain-containing histidine kinase, partial [Anaerotignum faecicola]|nr:HAMP domain-containing histidine kinase [Anaerotignum faecicola]